jgi:hypothetical protein
MPKINTPLKLDKFYQLDLEKTKEQITEIEPSLSAKPGGINMAMRKFFANSNGGSWENEIHSVDVSTSGAKGGVLFLYEKDPNNIPPVKNQPSYVVKLTDAPQRVLFAEYVLKKIGNAKIPKSLVVELDWTDFNTQYTDGMKLVNIILKNRHPNVNQDPNKKTKYDDIINNQLNQANPKAAYIIIMKAFVGDQIATVSKDLENWLLKPQNKDADKTTKFSELKDENKQDPDLVKIAIAIAKTKKILNDSNKMKSLGRVLAADTLLGNADRFEYMNVGNAFFMPNKTNATNATKNDRIGVIDNDAFLSVYNPNKLHPIITQFYSYPDQKSSYSYVEFLLKGGEELLPESEYNIQTDGSLGKPQGFNPAPTSSLTQLFSGKNFDNRYFVSNFFGKLLAATGGKADFQLLIDLYKDDGAIIGQGTSYPVFAGEASDDAWQQVKKSITAGFVEGLDAIKKMKIDEYLFIYAHLVGLYGFDENFDFTAFKVRYFYMLKATLDLKKGTFSFSDHETIVADIQKNYLSKQNLVIPEIQEAFTFGIAHSDKNNQNLLNKTEINEITAYVSILTEEEQRNITPQVTGQPNLDYDQRVKAVRCAVLKRFKNLIENAIDKTQSSDSPFARIYLAAEETKKIVKNLEEKKFYKKNNINLGIRKTPNRQGNQLVEDIATLVHLDLSNY